MKTHLTLLLTASFAALSLPSCVSFDDDDDVVPVTTTTVTEQTNPVYSTYPGSVAARTTTTRTTRTAAVRVAD
ncbi:MAG: hypothetical protein ACO1TE_19035 [Prosthecobacter sp.]